VITDAQSGWQYHLSICAPLDASIHPNCAAGSTSYAYQITAGACIDIGATRGAAAVFGNASAPPGLVWELTGASKCGGEGAQSQRARVVLECAPDVKRSKLVSYSILGGCYYELRVQSPSGCPDQCPLDERTGLACGGGARGACRVDAGRAACVCAAGVTGAACEEGGRAPVPSVDAGALPPTALGSLAAPLALPPLLGLLVALAGLAHAARRRDTLAASFFVAIAMPLLAELLSGASPGGVGVLLRLGGGGGADLPPAAVAPTAEGAIARDARALAAGAFTTAPPITWLPLDASLLVPASPAAPAAHVLFFGDSVDRYVLLAGCAGRSATEFAAGVLRYEWDQATLRCSRPFGESLGYTYMFGSRVDGPWYNPQGVGRDAYQAPRLRVPLAVQLFSAANGGTPPNCIVYQTVIYDLSVLDGKEQHADADITGELARAAIADYIHNVGLVLDQLAALLPDAVVLLRTSPMSMQSTGRPFRLHAELNAATRELGRVRGVGVLDWDAMLRGLGWGAGKGIAGGTMRDELHPNEAHSAAFADFAAGFCRHALALEKRPTTRNDER